MKTSSVQKKPEKLFKLAVTKKEEYLHFKVIGPNTPEVVRDYLKEVYDTSARRKCTSVLVEEDLKGPGMSIIDLFRIAAETGESMWTFFSRVAYVDVNPEHSHENLQFGETVAKNRGLNMRLFRDLSEAEKWMKEAQVQS